MCIYTCVYTYTYSMCVCIYIYTYIFLWKEWFVGCLSCCLIAASDCPLGLLKLLNYSTLIWILSVMMNSNYIIKECHRAHMDKLLFVWLSLDDGRRRKKSVWLLRPQQALTCSFKKKIKEHIITEYFCQLISCKHLEKETSESALLATLY